MGRWFSSAASIQHMIASWTFLDGFELGLTIRHAAGKIRNGRNKSAAILLGERFDDDLVMWALAHVLIRSCERIGQYVVSALGLEPRTP